MTEPPITRKILRNLIAREMQSHGYRAADKIFVQKISDDMESWVGYPTTWSKSEPPIADVGPIIGLRHLPTQKLYNKIAEVNPPDWVGPTVTFGPHQIDKYKFKSRWFVPLNSSMPSLVMEMVKEIDVAAKILANQYPTIEKLLDATYANPLVNDCRRPFVLLTLGRAREAKAFAEYGIKEIGDENTLFYQQRRRLFEHIIEQANEMERQSRT